MMFIGYESGSKGYRFFDPVTNKLVVSRDVVFEENTPWDWESLVLNTGDKVTETFVVDHQFCDQTPTISTESNIEASSEPTAEGDLSASQGSAVGHDAVPSSPHTPLTSTAQTTGMVSPPVQSPQFSEGVPLRYRTLANLFDSTEEIQDFEYSGLCMLAADEPKNFEQAIEQDCWRNAMEEEIKSIHQNETWEVTELPKDHKAIGLKWVFKVKRDATGKVVKYKARLVAKGYAQIHGVDYDEVFAPAARLETVRLLLALAAQGEWEVHHMDVKSAFLNGDLTEEVYVHQPPGFTDPSSPKKVLKLNKALYGLKQAPRAWNARLDKELVKLGFRRSREEHAVYKRGKDVTLLLIGVYVDDLIICGPDKREIHIFKQQMMKSFSMSDLGLLSYYLGIEVKQRPGEITICQSAYAAKIIESCGMKGCNPADTPMEQHVKLLPGKPDQVLDVTRYRSIVGSLRYLVNTRPDLAYSVGIVSRFMETPNAEHSEQD
jgi:hypothetical protein